MPPPTPDTCDHDQAATDAAVLLVAVLDAAAEAFAAASPALGGGDPPATPPSAYYVIRQARTRVIGSRRMSRADAEREVAAWTDPEHGIGAARAVPATAELKRAILCYDQAVLVPALYPEGVPA